MAASAKGQARKHVSAALDAVSHIPRKTAIVRTNPLEARDSRSTLMRSSGRAWIFSTFPRRTRPRLCERSRSGWKNSRRVGHREPHRTPRQYRNPARPEGGLRDRDGKRPNRRTQLGFGDLFSPLGIDRTPASRGRSCWRSVWPRVRLAFPPMTAPSSSSRTRGISRRGGGGSGDGLRWQDLYPSLAGANRKFRFLSTRVGDRGGSRVVAKADEMEAQGVGAFTVNGAMFDGPLSCGRVRSSGSPRSDRHDDVARAARGSPGH